MCLSQNINCCISIGFDILLRDMCVISFLKVYVVGIPVAGMHTISILVTRDTGVVVQRNAGRYLLVVHD